MNLLLVMSGGAVGAGMRHLAGRALLSAFGSVWPWGTMIINVSGGLMIGVLTAVLARLPSDEPWRLLLAVGMLGGFTTFSAFALETATMIERGALVAAAGYAAASTIGSVFAVFVGFALARTAA